MFFSIKHIDTRTSARTGMLYTAHGNISTPVFMPVGTAASVKSVHFRELKNDIGAQIILGNTYHLFLRPGIEIIKLCGGLHKFIGWDKPILTDSGGYQVFSLAAKRKLTAEGVVFQSHIDGTKYMFTPEKIVDIQRIIGSDIMMALDECTPYPCERAYAKKSMLLTHQWLKRGIDHFTHSQPHYGYEQIFSPIVQGSVFADLRKESASFVADCESDMHAIGGLSVGEPEHIMYEMIEVVNEILPVNKPRYLMGVGTPANILEAIARGIDMFDCVMPTRNGRNGWIFTKKGIMNIRNEKWKNDFSVIDEDSPCFVDTAYSKAYIRHLFIAKEMLGAQIASIHNLYFYNWLVQEVAAKIADGSFAAWKNDMVKQVAQRL